MVKDNGKGNFFEWVGKPNDVGPRTKGLPRENGKPTIVEPTGSYRADLIDAFNDTPGGVYAET